MPTAQQQPPKPTPAAARKWDGQAKDLPRHALQFRSAFKFDDVAAKADGATGETVPFTMTARTGEAIEHWYWGNVVHDMAGMQLSKPTLPVDYCHDSREVLGFADKFDIASGDLVVSGALTPFDPEDGDDRAAEVVYKQKLGVPYEASIDFSGGSPVIEYIPMDATIEVNGKAFTGPGVVIRQWTLRGLAICPYGADPNTSTEFAASADTVSITAINSPQGETQMSKTNTTDTTKPAPAAPAAAGQLQQAAPVAPVTEPKPQDKYITAFGDSGARWFLEGKTFEDCSTEFTSQLKTSHAAEIESLKTQFAGEKAAIQGKLDAAEAKLAAIGRGDKGVTFSNADGGNVDPKALKLKQNLGDGVGTFAASIKLPGAKK